MGTLAFFWALCLTADIVSNSSQATRHALIDVEASLVLGGVPTASRRDKCELPDLCGGGLM
jgi:hypothetical protein